MDTDSKKIKLARKITQAVAGSSAAATTTMLIAQHVIPMNRLQYVQKVIGSAAIGSMVGAKVRVHAGLKFDEILAGVDDIQSARVKKTPLNAVK